MRSITQVQDVHATTEPEVRLAATAGFDRLASRLRRAGLVWVQAEPGHVRWSGADDDLTRLVSGSPWIRRQVDACARRWSHDDSVIPEQAMPGCWLLPSGTRRRCDGVARGIAVALTRKALGPQGCIRALCQGARMDLQLTVDRMLQEPLVSTRELPRLAAMVQLVRPASLRAGVPAGVEALMQAVETAHGCVRRHSERTSRLAVRLATEVGFSPRARESIRIAALLHDVGKLGVPERVLRKPGALDVEERMLMEMHPEIGQRIVQGVGGLDHAVPAVLWHHERWDGLGYPHRLSGERIPREARLMAIADSFDAMRSDRPYRKALTPEAALQEIRDGAGRQFDPAMVETFSRMVAREPALAA